MSILKVISYKTDTHKEPFTEWLDDLDIKTRNIIIARISRVRLGNFGDCKPLRSGNGIYELRVDYGPGYRIYYGKKGLYLIIILIGGSKRSQDRDIAKAKRYWAAYQEE